jgi:hypothetical protein
MVAGVNNIGCTKVIGTVNGPLVAGCLFQSVTLQRLGHTILYIAFG